MPIYHRFGLDNYQNIAPARAGSSQNRPDEPIERPQRWSRPFPLQHGELVAECDEFDSNVRTCLEEDSNRGAGIGNRQR